jgi:hypothetical protein
MLSGRNPRGVRRLTVHQCYVEFFAPGRSLEDAHCILSQGFECFPRLESAPHVPTKGIIVPGVTRMMSYSEPKTVR